jgi:hypothetical protein
MRSYANFLLIPPELWAAPYLPGSSSRKEGRWKEKVFPEHSTDLTFIVVTNSFIDSLFI